MTECTNNPRPYFAHTVEGVTDTSQWEPLSDHLQRVADLTERFATAFGAGEWGQVAGVWHDLGKYSDGGHHAI